MTRIVLLLFCGALCSCGLPGLLHRQKVDSSAIQVVVHRSGDPFTPATASLEYPGQSAPAGPGANAGAAVTTGAAPEPMFDFSSAFSGGGMNSRLVKWQHSGSDAVTDARRSGRPLLIFLSHHQTPTAAMLEQMLNTAPEAATIDREFVPLYVDYADKTTRESNYYRALRERYRTRGYPVLIAALPDGTEVTRQNGYAGETRTEPEWRKRTFQFIKAAAAQSDKAVAARRKRLEAQGYRLWTGAKSAPVFAKLEKVDANQATFTSEWGETFRTFTSRLSEADQRFFPKPE